MFVREHAVEIQPSLMLMLLSCWSMFCHCEGHEGTLEVEISASLCLQKVGGQDQALPYRTYYLQCLFNSQPGQMLRVWGGRFCGLMLQC